MMCGVGFLSVVVSILMMQATLCSGMEFVFPNEEQVTNVISSGTRIVVGTTAALYDISTSGLNQLQRLLLSGRNRLLVKVNEGMFSNLVMSCDTSVCFLAELSNFTIMPWRVASDSVLRPTTSLAPGIFALSASDLPELLYVDSATSTLVRRIVRGQLKNVNLAGPFPPSNSVFGMLVMNDEARSGEFNYYLQFSHNNFLYMIADREIDDNEDPIPAARVLRFCSNDSTSTRNVFRSYMELKLSCGSGTSITAAAFVSAQTIGQPTLIIAAESGASSKSYICAYNLTSIDAAMLFKFEDCLAGQGMAGFTRYGTSQQQECRDFTNLAQKPTLCSFPSDYLPGLEVASNLQEGVISGRNYPMGEELTSLTTASLEGNLYIFAGSNMGSLHQYAVPSNTSVQYVRSASIDVSTSPVISHLVPAPNGREVFAITPNKIVTHDVDQCSLSRTCSECLSTGDALCGWCILRSSCVRLTNCEPVTDNVGGQQIVFENSVARCPAITSASPSVVHLEQLQTAPISITLTTASILSYSDSFSFSYECIYTFNSTSPSSPVVTAATSDSGTQSITCPTPRLAQIPAIPASTDNVESFVSIRTTKVQDAIATIDTPITFTNCSVHTSCASCRGSSVGRCLWCPLTFACVSDLGGSSKCPISGNAQLVETPQNSCLANILPNPNTTYYLVHVNYLYQQQPLRIFSEGLGIFTNGRFSCRLCEDSGCDSIIVDVAASLANNIITCNLNMLSYNSLSVGRARATLHLQVLVNNSVIDNPNMASVIVYSCPYLGTNCAQCLTIDSTNQNTFGCSYCSEAVESPGQCVLTAENNNKCSGKTTFSSIEECDTPSIANFSPEDGPTEGGTVVSVVGNNLGVERSHIVKVLVGGVNCSVISDSYVPGIGFDCITGPILNSLATKPLTLYLSFLPADQKIVSTQKFSYLAPSLGQRPATPARGPMAGGTHIEVSGSNIGIGTSHTILIRNMDCPIKEVNQNSIVCVTPPSNFSGSNNILKLFVDDFSTSAIGFDFTADPVFSRIEPNVAFFSGGTMFNVHGEHMDVVQVPRLIFYLIDTPNRQKRQVSQTVTEVLSMPCTSVNSSMLTCLAPVLNSSQFSAAEVSIGLLMDGVTSLLMLNASVAVSSDPIIKKFSSLLQYRENENFYLTIEGENFVFSSDQVKVVISPCKQSMCECTHIMVHTDNSSIVCQVRDPQDLPLNQDLSVTVRVGYYSDVVGSVRITPSLQLIIYLVPVFAFIIIFCVVVFIVLFAVFYRKARQKDQRYDQLMVELEKLESSVARECKLGFAELQTDLDELTGDVAGCRLPYHHIRTYLMSMLFPGSTDSSMFQPLQVPAHREKTMQRALSDFNDLLNDRKILLFLIQTLEEQRSFTIRDKSVVGSLLIIILHNRMDYATDVLKKLLSQLIRKTVTNSNPKLLLRRTESIAEKMLTNWLTLCLHGYIMEHAGQPMYLLYRAVKNQLEKGPVDVITGEARYSLSEQKLIRQKVDVVPINATVEAEDGLRVPVKLLDCDTISQAKEKLLDTMFKAAPVSQRPKLTEVDLEYLRSPSESIILRDEDHTTVVEGGWKNINTLKHYWVSDNASFRVISRKDLPPPGRAYDYLGSLISTHSRRQRALSEAEDGSRVWHLFKQVDSEDPRRSPFLNKKLVSEIYLPRMLSTKSILQNFVDELFNALFSVNHPPPSPTTMYTATFPQSPGVQVPMGYAPGAETVPMAIKYLFDFLDEEAELHKIADPDVMHTWKNNALSLRFWVNMIKNPEFVFDINKSHTVDACLSVIAQAFIDGCSPADMKLTIDSPTSKLLYNKEVQGYKSKVRKYYSTVKQLPKIPEDAMQYYLRQLSEYQCQQMKKAGSYEQDTALNELLRYATHYSSQFLHSLRAAGLQHRAQQFENILKLTQATTSTLI